MTFTSRVKKSLFCFYIKIFIMPLRKNLTRRSEGGIVLEQILAGIAASYASFFEFREFWDVVSDPVCWGVIGTLMLLEGLLSTDNALVLAVMVKHLPMQQQRKALFYGIISAYIFRFLAIGIGAFLIKIWWIKLIGAVYLLWVSAKHFLAKSTGPGRRAAGRKMGFWHTVLAVEVMDIAFSVDSVLAAFGVSDEVWVLYLGGILGVLMMRSVAQLFLILIRRYPELETTAFVLIAVIGFKMLGAVFHVQVNDAVFFSALMVIFLSGFVLHHFHIRRF